jgi:hypothetical protein
MPVTETRDTKPLFYKAENGYQKPIVNVERLKGMVHKDLKQFADEYLDGNLEGGEQYLVAVNILERYFGFKWIEKHILDEPQNGFLGRELTGEAGSSIVMRKVINLAEFLINLAPKENIETILHMIASGEIESSYAELEVAKLLMTRNVNFHFVTPSIKGESFDLLIDAPFAAQVCADTKCKLEAGEFSAKGILHSLKQATKRNLPKDRPGTIFLKIPQEWQASPSIWVETQGVCREFLKQHLRLVSITIFASHILPVGDMLRFWFAIVEITSHIHRFNPEVNWKFFDGKNPQNSTPASWITLEDILKSTD